MDAASITELDLASRVGTTRATGLFLPRCGFCQQVASWIDGTGLYVASYENGSETSTILRLPLDQGDPQPLWTGPGVIFAITTDDCNVYWLGTLDTGNPKPALKAIPK